MAARKVACVEIGGIPIALATGDERFFELLRQRYEGFLSSSRPEFELEFDLADREAVSHDEVRVRRDANNNGTNNNDWLIERGDFRARWDPRTGRGRVRQNANPYSVDSVLRILHSLILAERGGFLL
ncbi:MAG: hypothetical protein ABSD64_09460, partial [Terriglobales bacterium]